MNNEIYFIEGQDGDWWGPFEEWREVEEKRAALAEQGETECAIITYKISKTETVELSEE